MSLNFYKPLSELSKMWSSTRSQSARMSSGRKRKLVRQRIVLESLEDRTLLSLFVATDQTDYLPGATAQISAPAVSIRATRSSFRFSTTTALRTPAPATTPGRSSTAAPTTSRRHGQRQYLDNLVCQPGRFGRLDLRAHGQ